MKVDYIKLITAAENDDVVTLASVMPSELNEVCDDEQDHLLHLAVAYKNYSSVSYLLKSSIDLQKVNISKQTALHIAAMRPVYNILLIMLEHYPKESLFSKDNFGLTPLHYAAKHCSDINCLELIFSKLTMESINKNMSSESITLLKSMASKTGNKAFISFLKKKMIFKSMLLSPKFNEIVITNKRFNQASKLTV